MSAVSPVSSFDVTLAPVAELFPSTSLSRLWPNLSLHQRDLAPVGLFEPVVEFRAAFVSGSPCAGGLAFQPWRQLSFHHRKKTQSPRNHMATLPLGKTSLSANNIKERRQSSCLCPRATSARPHIHSRLRASKPSAHPDPAGRPVVHIAIRDCMYHSRLLVRIPLAKNRRDPTDQELSGSRCC